MSKDSNFLTSTHQLKQVFEFIDTNGDGKISPVELGKILTSLGHDNSSADEEAKIMVREMDCDGDGFVDFNEFLAVMTSAGDRKGVNSDKDGELLEVFMVFDADKNGFISAEELQRVLVSLGCKDCSLKKCRCMIQGIDKDGDGCVNFEEFKSMMMMKSDEGYDHLGCCIRNSRSLRI